MSSNIFKSTIISFRSIPFKLTWKKKLNVENHRLSKKFSNWKFLGWAWNLVTNWKGKKKKNEKRMNGQMQTLMRPCSWEKQIRKWNKKWTRQERKGIPRINYERIQFRFFGYTLERLWIWNEIRTDYFKRVKIFLKSFCVHFVFVFFFLYFFWCVVSNFPPRFICIKWSKARI